MKLQRYPVNSMDSGCRIKSGMTIQGFLAKASIFNSNFHVPHSTFRIPLPTSPFRIPVLFLLFPHDLIDHGLGVGGRVGAGTIAAHMSGGLAFNDLQTVGIPGKLCQTSGIGA